MDRLRQYLEDTGTSQKELARDLDVSQPTISDWISGEKSPSAANLRKLAEKTRLSIDELLDLRRQAS